MQEIHVPRSDVRLSFDTLVDLITVNENDEPDREIMVRRSTSDPNSPWEGFTHAEYDDLVTRTAKGLLAAGIRPGDHVAIMSRTRFEWTQADLALWRIGAVPVPIYDTSSAEQAHHILADSDACAVLVETSAHAELVAMVRADLETLKHVWCIAAGDLDALVARADETDDDALRTAGATVTPQSVATIIYTSGTTGVPKGCPLTHHNFVGLTESIVHGFEPILYAPGSSTVLFLPLAHVLQRIIAVAMITARMRIGFSPDLSNLVGDLQSFKPTFVLGVPRVFEKVYNAAQAKAAASGRKAVFVQATRVAVAYSRALDGVGPSRWLRVQRKLFDVLVYSKLREAMGGHVTHAVCGGAQLGTRLGHFFRSAGLTILEGYGLTETTAPISANTIRLNKVGTVGRPLANTSVRISETGEVLVKGVGVFDGYRNDSQANEEAFTEDGWFRTGDLGSLDSDGCLSLTGRSKEVLVTAGGKNVSPAPLEDRIRAHPLVAQVMVVGDNRPFVGALVTLDPDMVPSWAKGHNRPDLTPETALTDPFVHERIQMAVDRANRNVSRAESVRKFRIISGSFTEENGMLTPSMKIRRDVITEARADEIEALYAEGEAANHGTPLADEDADR